MASDLSTLIQEGICNTINGLVARDTTLKETTKAVKEDMPSINLLKVESTFEFDNITSTWTFFIPAYTASYIFNLMLGDDSEPVLEIDDDIADAMKEVVSNLSGGLTTAINGENFEDLGQSKFATGEGEKISSEVVEDFENMYKFMIDLDGKNIFLFIQYDQIILPFLELLSNSKESAPVAVAEEQPEESLEDVLAEELDLEIEEPQADNSPTEEVAVKEEAKPEAPKEDKKENKKADTESSENEESPSPKKNKLKLIIIIISALLALTIIAGIVMYFMGAFDEPEPVKDINATKQSVMKKDDTNIPQYTEKKAVYFKISDINKKRLNARLEALTKYEILDEAELQAQKAAEKERLYQLQKEQQLLEFAAQNKEEDIFTRKEDEDKRVVDITTKFSDTDLPGDQAANTQQTDSQNTTKVTTMEKDVVKEDAKTEENNITPSENIETNKLKFVLVESLKYKLYNDLISQVTTKNARVSICKNEQGRTAVYIGPFANNTDQSVMLKLIQEQNIQGAVLEDLTQEQFDTRCSFE